MKRLFIIVAALLVLAFAGTARAALEPGVYDPGNTGCPVAEWHSTTHTLRLEKNCATETNAAAGADITGFNDSTVYSLSFELYQAQDGCKGGSPRFNLYTDEGTVFLGCNNVESTPLDNGWSKFTFTNEDGWNINEGITLLVDVQGGYWLRDIRVNGYRQVPLPVVVPVVPASGPEHTFLCYSHFAGSIPDAVQFEDVALRLSQGWFNPSAIRGNVEGGDNIGAYHLVCNTDGLKATGTGIGGEGDYFDSQAWLTALSYYGNPPINHYELYQ